MTAHCIAVDLTDSNCGPGFRTVEVRGEWPDDWSDNRVRRECATYYAVPLTQVSIRLCVVDLGGSKTHRLAKTQLGEGLRTACGKRVKPTDPMWTAAAATCLQCGGLEVAGRPEAQDGPPGFPPWVRRVR